MTLQTVQNQNGTRQVVSVEWDDAFSGNFPPKQTDWQRAINQAAAELQTQPGIEQGRLARGLELALAGKVEASKQGHIVRSGSHVYHIGPEGCTCKDAETNSRYCKHFIAMLLTTRAQAATCPGEVEDAIAFDDEPEADSPWRQTVLEVAARATNAMPASINHIEAAVNIVLADDVIPEGRNRFRVGGADDPELYIVQEGVCSCPDADRQPDGWCRHKFAAVIYDRARQAVQAAEAEMPEEPPDDGEDAEQYEVTAAGRKALVDTATLPAWQTQQAPSSVSIQWITGGVECRLTLRDSTDAGLFERIKKVLPRIHAKVEEDRAKQQAAIDEATAAGKPTPESWCALHQVEMQRHTKDGRSWYSHRTDDGWCRGK
jgi:hypothetical protein